MDSIAKEREMNRYTPVPSFEDLRRGFLATADITFEFQTSARGTAKGAGEMARSIETAAYWTERDAEIEADAREEAAFAASDEGQLIAAQRRLAVVTSDYAAYTAADRAAAIEAIAVIQRRMQEALDADWTRERTMERRAAWNAAVQNPANRTPDGKTVLVGKIVNALGFTVDELKAAVARHGL